MDVLLAGALGAVGSSPDGALVVGRAALTTERVGGGTRNSRPVYRSASSGRFVTKSHARRSPHTTIRQMVCIAPGITADVPWAGAVGEKLRSAAQWAVPSRTWMGQGPAVGWDDTPPCVR